MVVASDEIPGPARKRPRLSLKSTYRKHGDVQLAPSGDHRRDTPHDIRKETVPAHDTSLPAGLSTEEEELADDSVSFAPNEGPTVPPVSSLENIGNTCFLNSVLQVLRYTPMFLDGLGELFREIVAVEKTKNNDGGLTTVKQEDAQDKFLTWEFVKQLFTLYKNMEKREERYFEFASADITSMAVKPNRLLDTIRSLNPMFEGNLQHDAQELLRCVLCYLEEAEEELHRAQLALSRGRDRPPTPTRADETRNPIMQRFLDAGKTSGRVAESGSKSQFGADRGSSEGQGRSQQTSSKFDEVDGAALGGGDAIIQDGGHLPLVTRGQTLTMRTVKRRNVFKTESEVDQTTSSRVIDDLPIPKSVSEPRLLTSGKTQASIASLFQRNKPPGKRLGVRRRVAKVTQKSLSEIHTNVSDSSDDRCMVDNEVSFRINLELSSDRDAQCSGPSGSVLTAKQERFPVLAAETQNKKTSSPKRDVTFVKSDCDASRWMSPKRASSDVSQARYPKLCEGGGSPREIKISLTKCDHVCNSPLKSVIAREAMKTLGCAVRRVDFDRGPLDSKANENDADNDNVDIYSDESSENDAGDRRLKTVPVRPLTVRVVKCDRVCDSPEKRVSAAFAMRCLSPGGVTVGGRMDFVERLFEGSMVLRTRCLECESFREKTEAFQDVSVPIRSERDDDADPASDTESDDDSCLSKLMAAFTEVERLRDDNKYYCDQCLCYVEAERSLHYHTLPNILTLHLKRFSTSAGMFGSHSVTKINDHVTIPLALPCLRYKCPKPCVCPEHRYTLFGIVTHAGMTISSGHYLSYVRVMTSSSQTSRSASTHTRATPADCSKDFQQVTESGDNPLSQQCTAPQRADNFVSGADNSLSGKDTALESKDNCMLDKDGSSVKNDNCVLGKDNSYTKKDNSSIGKDNSCAEQDNSSSDKDNCVSEKTCLTGKDNSFAGKDNCVTRKDNCATGKDNSKVEWLECDDECIRVHSDEDFCNYLNGNDGSLLGSPYVLFYRKVKMEKLG